MQTKDKIYMKEIFNLKEVLEYTGLSKSYLYKLTSSHKIPCSKPGGKLLFFRKSDIDNYLLSNHRVSTEEIDLEANRTRDILFRGNK